MKRTLAILLASVLAGSTPALAVPVAGERLSFGLVGNAAGEGVHNPTDLLSEAVIQDLMIALARHSMSEEEVRSALAGSDAKVADLIETGLVRKAPDGRFVIAIALFTAEDGRLIRSVTARAAASLADALLRDRSGFDRTLARYDLPGADRKAVAMALVGCALLDWDGLTVTHELGLRTQAPDRGRLGQYSVWAREKADDLSIRGVYWGSHSNQFGEGWFTSFGDHHSLPRLALPDLEWSVGSAALDARFPKPLRLQMATAVREALAASEGDAMKIMLALRSGSAERAVLLAAAGLEAGRGGKALGLLRELGYVRIDGDLVLSRVPVFTTVQDGAMIAAVKLQGEIVLKRWLKANAPSIRAELASLSALKAGVPYEELFTQLWHDIFGLTNLELVRRGWLADPYGPETAFNGFVPFVWQAGLKLND